MMSQKSHLSDPKSSPPTNIDKKEFIFLHTQYRFKGRTSETSGTSSISEYSNSSIVLDNSINSFEITNNQLVLILRFMLGRDDFYWEYSSKGVPFCKKEKITPTDLTKHFLGSLVLGLSPFINDTCIMFGAIDFDAHTSDKLTEEENEKLIIEAQEDSKKVFEFLKERSLPVIRNSSGSKGRHVRLYCEGVKAKDIRIFLRYVQEQTLGDSDKHEIFPKQDCLEKEKPFGNQIKGFLGIHPKTKLRSNIMAGNRILDVRDSIKYLIKLFEAEFKDVKMPKEDYDRLTTEEKAIKFLSKAGKVGKFELTETQDVPKYCSVIENVASKFPLPSNNKHARHTCLDPNIASYGIDHPEARQLYSQAQGRTSNTAFDNWSKYWKSNPVFNCSQIIAYLKDHAKGNPNALKGLECCIDCPVFKKFLEEKKAPVGYCNDMIISEIAKAENLLNCPKCKTKFIFNNNKGFWCKTCEYGGGIKKFAKLCLDRDKEQLQ
jgi:hypothetical protein